MKKRIRKTLSIIAILTMAFQLGMPIIPVFQKETFATDTIVENTDTTEVEEISRNYEMKEKSWDISVNGDGSIVAKWTAEDRTLRISGSGSMRDWTTSSGSSMSWQDTLYANEIEKVVIEKGITNIGDHAFDYCTDLESITIPEGITSIGSFAFSGCSNLVNITIPEGVTEIGWYAFSGCSSLVSITIPDSVTSMEDDVFSGCSSLVCITIPESVTSIEYGTFEGCSSLESINVNENNKYYVSENGILFNKNKTKIIKYPAGKKDMKEYTIPDDVTVIGEYAFSGCNNLENINISNNVTKIDNYAFKECSSLTNIHIPEGITYIGAETFAGCSSLKTIKIPNSITHILIGAFKDCINLASINIPDSVTRMGEEVFRGCNSLESIDIPDGISSIGEYLFFGCSNLESITIPEGVKSIGSSAFYGCKNLKNITIPEGVKSIGSSAFNRCSSLESITIPEGITNIEVWTFNECNNLKKVELPESIISIGQLAFSGCNNLENIIIPANVTTIENYAFSGCDSLKTINIPEGVTNIDRDTFSNNTIIYTIADSEIHRYLEEVKRGYILEGEAKEVSTNYEIKEEESWDVSENEDGSIIAKWTANNRTLNITGMGKMKDTYANSESWYNTQYEEIIEKVLISEGITNIGNSNFSWCTSLTSIEIPDSVKEIGRGAFRNCSSLKTIDIPNEVTVLNTEVFSGCENLESINLPSDLVRIEDSAFSGCTSLESITIPESVISIGSAFNNCSNLTNIFVDLNNKNYMSQDGVLFSKDKTTLVRYPAKKQFVENYEIPSSVTILETGAFNSCNLISITIPNTVKEIRSSVFANSENLESVTLPKDILNIPALTFLGCASLENIEIPTSVTVIEKSAFYGCYALKSINIPDSVTSIEDYAFEGCSSLESINIPCGLINIGEEVFYGCRGLKRINIPSSVTKIGDNLVPITTIIYTKSNTEGHRYAEENKQGYIIDDIAPTVTFTPNIGENAQKEYNIELKVQDNMEKVGVNENSLKYQWIQSETDPTKESFIEDFENGQTITKNTGDGKWYLWVYAKDNVGNETITRSGIFNFDNTAPNGSIEYSTKNPTKENVIVTITSNEEIQEVEGWMLSSDKKVLTKEYSKNIKEAITIKDLAGNETEANIEINNIDKVAPNVKVEYSTKNPTNKNVKVTITANEEIQSIEGWTLSSDKKTLTKEYSENTKETIVVKDIAGNEVSTNIEITNIDKTLPEITIGDINNDGNIDITDLFLLKRHIIAGSREGWKLTGESLTAADINEDGNVDVTDLLILKRELVQNV